MERGGLSTGQLVGREYNTLNFPADPLGSISNHPENYLISAATSKPTIGSRNSSLPDQRTRPAAVCTLPVMLAQYAPFGAGFPHTIQPLKRLNVQWPHMWPHYTYTGWTKRHSIGTLAWMMDFLNNNNGGPLKIINFCNIGSDMEILAFDCNLKADGYAIKFLALY